ncbi:MAG TPA: phosphate uptake regulator PhoU [Nitrososphaerales archaeon]|nr:phosphate uptake regulator PhoU [Nitrososphaerales archaeon]
MTDNLDPDAQEIEKQWEEQPEIRKLQLTGGSTLIVSLPSHWAKSAGLSAKDKVYLIPQPDLSLLVLPDSPKKKVNEGLIEISTQTDSDEALREFIAYYVAGYDLMRVSFKGPQPLLRTNLKSQIRSKLIGVEIVDESLERFSAQCLHGPMDLPVKRALERMSIIAGSMHVDAVKSLVSVDEPLANEIIERDDEVDRFSHFIARQLNLAVHNRSMIQAIGLLTAQDCLNYRLLAKIVERVADHAVQIANSTIMLEKRKVPQQIASKLEKVSKLSSGLYESSIRSLHAANKKLANTTISQLKLVLKEEESAVDELISSKIDNRSVMSLRLALESLRRISEYSTDICEMLIDMNVGTSSQTS